MRSIKFVFQTYYRVSLDSFEWFLQPIISSVDPKYKHIVSPITTIYTPIHEDDVKFEKDRGLMVSYFGEKDSPHIVAYQIDITFLNVPEDYSSMLEELLLTYSNSAVKYEIVQNVYLESQPL